MDLIMLVIAIIGNLAPIFLMVVSGIFFQKMGISNKFLGTGSLLVGLYAFVQGPLGIAMRNFFPDILSTDVILFFSAVALFVFFAGSFFLLLGALKRNTSEPQMKEPPLLQEGRFETIPPWVPFMVTGVALNLLFIMPHLDKTLTFIFVIFSLIYIASVVLGLILIYQVWTRLSFLAEKADVPMDVSRPGAAIGFLFVPVFNLYWMFVIYNQAANTINQGIGKNKVSKVLAISVPLLTLLTLVPVGFLQLFSGFATLYLSYLFWGQCVESLKASDQTTGSSST